MAGIPFKALKGELLARDLGTAQMLNPENEQVSPQLFARCTGLYYSWVTTPP